ncbi:hypothetical protein CERZMDRAFT_122177 [Cercospora zeae-maydis SCOH1-5]|uniref:ADP-ribosylation factor n=1 Tax=Cercospora zeae-maydis SCOH1-5 TaxID=717836 RepID=A0A6A6F7J3_9PEZI|nr:hypothetical protein CERZMDRAFT_122177 [Cercospora zeae-maydis SCOH1-5]
MEPFSNRDTAASNAGKYYSMVGDADVHHAFHCLDDPSSFADLLEDVRSTDTRNFVVDFSDDTAWAAFDLPAKAIAALIETEKPYSLNTRWINVWHPFEQTKTLEALAQRFDFSPRLLGLMCSDPKQPRITRLSPSLIHSVHKRSSRKRKAVSFEASTGCEEADELSIHSSTSSMSSAVNGNHYKIASELWHYTSIDMGRNYLCLGYNSLYGTKPADRGADSSSSCEALPHCTRVWTWLVLTSDNTVITVHEDPFPLAQNHYSPLQKRILAELRRNLVGVFQSLSTVNSGALLERNPLTLLPLRARLGTTPEETAHRSSDAPGLLFYYLFENWSNSFTLVTRKDSRYGVELAWLRAAMFEQPTLEHIDRLDTIGKELGVLRRHYDSYIRIIDRLLEPPGPTMASLQNSQVVGSDDSASVSTIGARTNGVVVHEKESMLGISLSSAARIRFRRFRDQIDLYALKEVEEYSKQKESLVSLNFSLIAIKQSIDVDRLTRIGLLLTKAATLFLPVSFMTGYFSMPLDDIQYSARSFWISFAIVLILSYLALFVCGVINGNLQTPNIFSGVADGMWKSVGYSWSTVVAIKRKVKQRRS